MVGTWKMSSFKAVCFGESSAQVGMVGTCHCPSRELCDPFLLNFLFHCVPCHLTGDIKDPQVIYPLASKCEKIFMLKSVVLAFMCTVELQDSTKAISSAVL